LYGGMLYVTVLWARDVQEQFRHHDALGQDSLSLLTGNGVTLNGDAVVIGDVEIGTVQIATGSLNIQFGPDATLPRVEQLISQIGYANTSDDPSDTRTLALTITDGAGGTVRDTTKLVITPENDAPEMGQPETQVNVFTQGEQDQAQIATLTQSGEPSGFVVVWTSNNQDATGDNRDGIFGQLFDVQGLPVGGEFQVNTTTKGHQDFPDVIGLATGGFAVAWQDSSRVYDPNYDQVLVQLFDADGGKRGGEIHLDTADRTQYYPALAAHADGSFSVARQIDALNCFDLSLIHISEPTRPD